MSSTATRSYTLRDRVTLARIPSALALVLALVVGGCRKKDVAATADPVASSAPKPPPPATAPTPKVSDKAIVTTARTEIARTGLPPVVLELPVVSGLRDPGLDEQVNALLTPEIILGQSLNDVREDAKSASASTGSSGVQSATYRVAYDDHGVLEIVSTVESNGAYPSTNVVRALIDLHTGKAITAAQTFRAARIPALVARLDVLVRAEVKASAALKDPLTEPMIRDAHFVADSLEPFDVGDDGLTFHYDYGFPHVALALQPPGEFPIRWSELAGDLDPAGPVARIQQKP